MTILIHSETKMVVQGLGRDGSFQASKCKSYGTPIVSAVHPGRGGLYFEDSVPIFDSVEESVDTTGANLGLIFVPAPFALDAIIEQVDSGIENIVCITEGIPVQDMTKVMSYIEGKKVRLIGPNCPGFICPKENFKAGIIPSEIVSSGPVGVVSRSGTLTYEAIVQLTNLGIGQSACIGIGGDPIHGTSFVDTLRMFEEDNDTKIIVMIGEIGGLREQHAAEYIKSNVSKPVVACIVGQTAPSGRRMGHAGAIVTGKSALAQEKIKVLKSSGAIIAESPTEIGYVIKEILK
ncbi:MAG: succinate--CoA ligase subunit alpha [Chloroflexi bacterium]|nr:succinate--CoA ligase subunit alpha [Chloroflexota bacterium]|tara:strand:- start:4606 stop:5478 length:873 start_codon:yes stop_codon:yes gene_type:complete